MREHLPLVINGQLHWWHTKNLLEMKGIQIWPTITTLSKRAASTYNVYYNIRSPCFTRMASLSQWPVFRMIQGLAPIELVLYEKAQNDAPTWNLTPIPCSKAAKPSLDIKMARVLITWRSLMVIIVSSVIWCTCESSCHLLGGVTEVLKNFTQRSLQIQSLLRIPGINTVHTYLCQLGLRRIVNDVLRK